MEFAIRAFGGCVGWDASDDSGSMFDDSSEAITHVVIDQPAVSGSSSTDGTPTTNAEDSMRRG